MRKLALQWSETEQRVPVMLQYELHDAIAESADAVVEDDRVAANA